MDRPFTTLFMIQSLDGKISTGSSDDRDFDKDIPKLSIKDGLNQYYEIEKTTDIFSLNSGRVMAKIGMNSDSPPIKNLFVTFIIIDNTHLTRKGIQNFIDYTKGLILVTTNEKHLAHKIKSDRLNVISYKNQINFPDLFRRLKSAHDIDKLTVQSGSTLNSVLIKEGLIDKVSVVIAPCLIGGINTSSLIGGESLTSEDDLRKIKCLKLINCKVLKNSYIHLEYEVQNAI